MFTVQLFTKVILCLLSFWKHVWYYVVHFTDRRVHICHCSEEAEHWGDCTLVLYSLSLLPSLPPPSLLPSLPPSLALWVYIKYSRVWVNHLALFLILYAPSLPPSLPLSHTQVWPVPEGSSPPSCHLWLPLCLPHSSPSLRGGGEGRRGVRWPRSSGLQKTVWSEARKVRLVPHTCTWVCQIEPPFIKPHIYPLWGCY